MTNSKPSNKIVETKRKKQAQLDKLESRISPLLEKKQKLVSEIKALEDQLVQARYSKILGVIKGIEGIDNLSAEQIEASLAKVAQSALTSNSSESE